MTYTPHPDAVERLIDEMAACLRLVYSDVQMKHIAMWFLRRTMPEGMALDDLLTEKTLRKCICAQCRLEAHIVALHTPNEVIVVREIEDRGEAHE